MLTKLRRHLTYANVVSTLCLFILLGGSAFAATRLSRNSVRSTHIKNGQVKRADLRASAVNSAKVGDASLLAQDFAPGQLPESVRSAFAADESLALVGVEGNALTTTINAPTSGYLFVSAGSDVFNFTTQDFVTCRVRVNGDIVAGSPRQIQLDGNGTENQEEDCATNGTLAVQAGTHTVDLEGAGLNANTVFDESSLQVLFVPLGADGTQP